MEQRKWDGSTDSGSKYYRLRQAGFGHADAVEEIERPAQRTDKQRIMDALNTMRPIRNKAVRKEFAEIYNKIYEICEGCK